MPCYNPLQAWRSRTVNAETGKRPLVFNRADGYTDLPETVPCGQCIGCRLERSRQWAVRCMHEATLHDQNCFVTLTYANPPAGGTLNVEDFQLFMKRLRKAIHPQTVRYFHVGEYGELLQRPHHHACLFGWRPPDMQLYSSRSGVNLYLSDMLAKTWGHGHVTVGDVTYESAAYCARYVLKKITGQKSEQHYQGRKPEYITMSRRPGIGHDWLQRYERDVYPHDVLVTRGRELRPPKYYDKIYDAENPEKMLALKAKRKYKQRNNPDRTLDRLAVKEEIKTQQIGRLKRGYENDH